MNEKSRKKVIRIVNFNVIDDYKKRSEGILTGLNHENQRFINLTVRGETLFGIIWSSHGIM